MQNVGANPVNLTPFFPTWKSPQISIDLTGCMIGGWGGGASCPACPPPPPVATPLVISPLSIISPTYGVFGVFRTVKIQFNVNSRRIFADPEDFLSVLCFLFHFIYFLHLHTGSCFPTYGRAPAPPRLPVLRGSLPHARGPHSWRAHSEDRETPGIEPGTSRSPDERSINWDNRPAQFETAQLGNMLGNETVMTHISKPAKPDLDPTR